MFKHKLSLLATGPFLRSEARLYGKGLICHLEMLSKIDEANSFHNYVVKGYSSPNSIILDRSKFQAHADDKCDSKFGFCVYRNDRKCFGKRKKKNTGYQHVLLFPKCFQKASSSRIFKSWDCVVNSYSFPKQALVFTYLQYKSFENTAEKGEIARDEQFLLFLHCFLHVWRAFCHFQQI